MVFCLHFALILSHIPDTVQKTVAALWDLYPTDDCFQLILLFDQDPRRLCCITASLWVPY